MKLNHIILPLAALLLTTACDDQIMKWGTPEGHDEVTATDIPLAVKEVLANYAPIKDYAKQYTPKMVVGLGMGANLYAENYKDVYQNLANDNFQMFTPGNAMKMDAVVGNSGKLTFTTIDAMLDAMPSDVRLYGHNFIWYQQQSQTYLKSLIAPTMVIKTDGDIASVLANGSFDTDLSPWSGWGNSSTREWVKAGEDGSGCVHLVNPTDADPWSAQMVQNFSSPLEPGKTYTLRFKARASIAAGSLQFVVQNNKTYKGEGYVTTAVGTKWQTYELTITTKADDLNQFCVNFGKVAAEYWIDDIQFGEKKEDSMTNVLAGDATDFEGGTTGGWGSWGSNKESGTVESGKGKDGSYGLVLKTKKDGNYWEAQCAYTFDTYLDASKKYLIQFWAKSNTSAGKLQFQYQNGSTYGSQGAYTEFNVGTDWTLCEASFTPAYDDVNRILINFGKVDGTYQIDNIKFGVAKDQGSAAGAKEFILARSSRPRRATSITYKVKTAEEKRTALLGAMEAWIKGMADHLAEKKVVPYGYDVVNEPITDGTALVRGVDEGAFGGSTTDDDGNTTYDSAPTESTTEGLNLNWGDGRFYWGYYVKDYAIKAFQYARQYLPAETKLFVNDYNLEVSPAKLAALVKFVKGIDEANGSPIVDGIGTQVHFDLHAATDNTVTNDSIIKGLRTKVDEMFRSLAASGKLVRVTELDVSLGTSSPSAAQYKCQSDCYKMIFESYKANIPEAQQSGITIWSLSDNEAEHEYWLKGDVPNLFDASYLRKWAYKGVCDGIAGEDLGLKYGGEDYKAYYEKQNVSSTVNE
jgi:endo-1,4-beta-xylanase